MLDREHAIVAEVYAVELYKALCNAVHGAHHWRSEASQLLASIDRLELPEAARPQHLRLVAEP